MSKCCQVTNKEHLFDIARNGIHPLPGIKKGILENKDPYIMRLKLHCSITWNICLPQPTVYCSYVCEKEPINLQKLLHSPLWIMNGIWSQRQQIQNSLYVTVQSSLLVYHWFHWVQIRCIAQCTDRQKLVLFLVLSFYDPNYLEKQNQNY